MDPYENAIKANIEALTEVIGQLAAQSVEATNEINKGNQNGAIGWMVEFEELLSTAKSLYGAARALHRQAPSHR
jgi:uncharacterized protein YukE